MSLKTWLVGLGLLGATQGAVAQTGEQKADDKKDNKVEAVTGDNTEEIKVTPAFRHTNFQYRFEEDEDGQQTVKVDIPLAKKRYNTAVMKRMGVDKDSVFKARNEWGDEEMQTTDSSRRQTAATSRKGDMPQTGQAADIKSIKILKMREEFMKDAER